MLLGLARDLGATDPGPLEAQLAEARARWPAAPEPDESFAGYVLARARLQPDLSAALARLRIGELYLAWWCSTGDSTAIAAFDAAHAEVSRRLLQRFHRLDPDELRQLLRIKLFVGEAPRIREYSGFGFLENWFKIVAARTFLDAARARDRDRTEALPSEHEVAGSDPRDTAARREIVAAIKRALDAAIGQLPPRERTFLRHVIVDGLTLDQIAETYQLHRGTVARTLATARTQLHAATRGLVLSELGTTSALALLDSELDLSLQRLFPEPTL